jgi:hypothetical protein
MASIPLQSLGAAARLIGGKRGVGDGCN